MKRTIIIFLAIIILTVVAGAIVYPQLPDQMASHWDASGQVNGVMDRFWGVLMMPIALVVLFLLYLAIPRIDPLKQNINAFRSIYDWFWIGLALFMAYIHGLTLIWNLGREFNFIVAMVPALAVLFWLIGWLIKYSHRNWFVGIRTPWTLSSDAIWDATHRLGSKLFMLAGVILLGALAFPQLVTWLLLVPVLAATFISVIYSYILYRRFNH